MSFFLKYSWVLNKYTSLSKPIRRAFLLVEITSLYLGAELNVAMDGAAKIKGPVFTGLYDPGFQGIRIGMASFGGSVIEGKLAGNSLLHSSNY